MPPNNKINELKRKYEDALSIIADEFSVILEDSKPKAKKTRKPKKPKIKEEPVVQKIEEPIIKKVTVSENKTSDNFFNLELNANNARLGFIYSEILGPPKCKNRRR